MEDVSFPSINFKSRWRGLKKKSDSSCSTIAQSYESSSCQTYYTSQASTQTESKVSTSDLDPEIFNITGWRPPSDVSSFILKAGSLIESQLEKNFNSLAFQGV
jgi:hypothetical protein